MILKGIITDIATPNVDYIPMGFFRYSSNIKKGPEGLLALEGKDLTFWFFFKVFGKENVNG
jgi:hypothetical protein